MSTSTRAVAVTGPRLPKQVPSTHPPKLLSIKPRFYLLGRGPTTLCTLHPKSLRPSFPGPSTYSCSRQLLPGIYLSVEVQEATGAVDVVEWGEGINGAIDAHGVQSQGPPASHQKPVGRGAADENLGVAP